MYLLNRDAGDSTLIKTSKFTFHYVSIKSSITLAEEYASYHLHSTMYLLNLMSSAMSLATKGFTFHYVSIKSYSTPAYIPDGFNLHSTMYLLNPVPQHLIISQAYFVLFCRPTIIHCNKICIHQKLSLFTA